MQCGRMWAVKRLGIYSTHPRFILKTICMGNEEEADGGAIRDREKMQDIVQVRSVFLLMEKFFLIPCQTTRCALSFLNVKKCLLIHSLSIRLYISEYIFPLETS